VRRGSVVLLKASEESLFLQKAEGRIAASQAGVECRSKVLSSFILSGVTTLDAVVRTFYLSDRLCDCCSIRSRLFVFLLFERNERHLRFGCR
jgi:hypothetical protein